MSERFDQIKLVGGGVQEKGEKKHCLGETWKIFLDAPVHKVIWSVGVFLECPSGAVFLKTTWEDSLLLGPSLGYPRWVIWCWTTTNWIKFATKGFQLEVAKPQILN